MDLIDRQAAIYAIEKRMDDITCEEFAEGMSESITEISLLPSAQPETAKRIVGKSRDGMTLWYQCDMCNEPVDAIDNFCRVCGRRLIDE